MERRVRRANRVIKGHGGRKFWPTVVPALLGWKRHEQIAGAILRTPVLWSYLGINKFSEQGPLRWLCDSTDRDYFFLPAGAQETLIQLERYI
jgi:hypothetical protein